jgi:hypothetical protein
MMPQILSTDKPDCRVDPETRRTQKEIETDVKLRVTRELDRGAPAFHRPIPTF